MKSGFTYVFVCLSLLLLGSCSSNETSHSAIESYLAELQKEVANLTDRVTILEQEGRVTKAEVSELNQTYQTDKESNNSLKAASDREIWNRVSILEKLVLDLENIAYEKGYMIQINQQNDYYTVEYEPVEMLNGEEAIEAVMKDQKVSRQEVSLPNGFYLREYPHIRKKAVVDKEALTFILDGAGHKSVSLSDLIEYENNMTYKSMYNFYIMNDKIVVIQEQYLP